MDINLVSRLYKIKDLIKETPEYINFTKLEQELENSDAVALLAYKKDLAIMEYEDVLKHFTKDSIEAINAKNNLDLTIRNLNENPLVIKYNEALIKLNLLLKEVEEGLLGDLND